MDYCYEDWQHVERRFINYTNQNQECNPCITPSLQNRNHSEVPQQSIASVKCDTGTHRNEDSPLIRAIRMDERSNGFF